jgi:hypothetical protein
MEATVLHNRAFDKPGMVVTNLRKLNDRLSNEEYGTPELGAASLEYAA